MVCCFLLRYLKELNSTPVLRWQSTISICINFSSLKLNWMNWREFICSLYWILYHRILFFKCQFVRGSFYAFVRFLFLLLSSSLLTYSIKRCVRAVICWWFICFVFNSIESLWFGSQWAVSRTSDQAHAHGRPFTYFLFPVNLSLLFVMLSKIILGDWRRNKCERVPYWEV